MFKEFKQFAMRGNVIDMAVGIIIGAAFGKIVSSFVSDVLMPPIGLLLGNVNFSDLSFVLKEKTAEQAAVVIKYGSFVNTIIDFLIISFSIFIVVKQINRFMPKAPAEPQTTKMCAFCKSTINIEATKCPQCTSNLS